MVESGMTPMETIVASTRDAAACLGLEGLGTLEAGNFADFVVYTDNPEPLIEAVPLHRQAAAIPFVKSPDYAPQQEYRFAVSTIGEPAQETLLVPTTPELRALATEAT